MIGLRGGGGPRFDDGVQVGYPERSVSAMNLDFDRIVPAVQDHEFIADEVGEPEGQEVVPGHEAQVEAEQGLAPLALCYRATGLVAGKGIGSVYLHSRRVLDRQGQDRI